MKTKFTETIDGSLKNIIQLKTLDNSLEFSQMFDALQDTPRDFQFKLMDALNSLGQTMEIPPTECFDKVLCASDDENPDVKKKMYNWWRAFFEVLGKVSDGKMPKVRVSEYNEKIDDLMAEIMKSGDKEASSGNEVVLEDGYEEAPKADEDDMLKDFDFAVQHIGEIANKVKDIVNFINPYCESVGGTSKMNENEVREFVKSIGFRPDSDGIDYETQLVDALTGKDTSYNAGWGAVYYNSDKVLQYLKKYGMLGSRGIKQKEAISKLRRLFKSGKWKTQQDEQFNEVDNTMKKTTNERGGSDWVSMDDIVGMEVGESDNGEAFWKAVDDVDDLERKGYWSGKFKVGDKVTWIEPNKGYPSDGWTVEVVSPGKHPSGDDLYIISRGKSSVMNIRGSELRPAKMMREVGESDWDGKSITRTLNFTKYEAEDLMDYIAEEIAHLEGEYSELNIMGIVPKRVLEYIEMKGLASSVKRLNPREVVVKWAVGSNDEDELAPARGMTKNVYDLVKDIYEGNSEYSESKRVDEASVVVDANDVWDVLDLLDDPDANKNLTDLINSHVRTEDEIMDAINSRFGAESPTKVELNDAIRDFWWIVSALYLDVEQFKKDGSFVDSERPVTLEGSEDEQKPDEVKDGEKKYKQDGETKTLVTGSDNDINNKQEVTEMTIEQEITDPWKLLEMLWGQGRENLRELLESELFDDEFVMQMIEDMEIHNLTSLNDAFAYDFESILDMFGCDVDAYRDNLEIKRAGDDSEEEED